MFYWIFIVLEGHLYLIIVSSEAPDSSHPNLAERPSTHLSSEQLAKFSRAPQIFKANISEPRRLAGPSPSHLTTGANTLHFVEYKYKYVLHHIWPELRTVNSTLDVRLNLHTNGLKINIEHRTTIKILNCFMFLLHLTTSCFPQVPVPCAVKTP